MPLLDRFSFRHLLLVAFLLIAALLGGAALRGLFTLEDLLLRSGAGARAAVAETAAVQQLGERTVAMERAARQYLVLDDPGLRQRFDEAAREAEAALQQLEGIAAIAAERARWGELLADVRAQLRGEAATLPAREAALAQAFRGLDELGRRMAEQTRRAADARNRTLLAELDAGRAQLGRQMLAAIAVAVLLALGFGLWLARPLRRLEAAVDRLGENRLDEPIGIAGPVDVRALGRRLEWLRLRLLELDADKSRFLRHVSHELKTPLAALREGVALLDEGVAGALSEGQREVARILRDNTAVLQAQIEGLLRFNAAAFEARRLARRRVDLKALVADCVQRQRLQWRARQIEVRIEGEALTAEVDPDKLGIALGNLLSNAIRFSPSRATIRWRIARHGGRAVIDIADEGPGVAAADRARIFEPFYRGELQPADAPRGSGLGLSIVHEVVTAHGGRIELLAEGPGAHFHIELPHDR